MISNYNLSCDYHNFELKDKIYLIPDYALKVIYTDGFNEVVFSGNSANVTILEGYDINFQEETSFDERFKFSKSVSIKVNGYKTFNDLDYRYYAIIETKEGEFYLVNVDFPSFVTHTYTLNNGTNSTELVFSSQSNIATLKLTNFNPNNVNSCKQYSNAKIKNVKLTEAWASYLSTWQKSLVNKGEFVDIEPLPDSVSLTEEFDGEKYTVTLGFDIPMSYYKNDWHIKLLQFEENKYRGYIELEDGNKAFVGYNVGLFPSYTINGDIISIRLTETAIRGIAYGNDYAIIDTDIPNTIEYNGASCYTYNWLSTCDWHVEDKPDYITITPTSGLADTQYELEICNTDDETSYEVSEFIIKSCNANARAEIIISNPIYRWVQTEETICVEPITRTISGVPFCDGYDKYVDVTNEISYDSGTTWEFVSSSTTLVESHSTDCGYDPYFDIPLTFEAIDDCNLGIASYGISSYHIKNLCYSLDSGSTWTSGDTSMTVSLQAGDTVMWKGRYTGRSTSVNEPMFNVFGTGRFKAYGNITSLLYGVPGSYYTSRPSYHQAFIDVTGLTDASDLMFYNMNSTAREMFRGCTSLTAIPRRLSGLPDTQGMFRECTSLQSIDLGECNLTRADYMFRDCTSLANVSGSLYLTPDEETLGSSPSFAGMFQFCTSLETAPNLPSTTLYNSCYMLMFEGCTSLATAPILPAQTLTNMCYNGMFSGCTSMNSITCLATYISASNCTFAWVTDVASSGTFYKNPNMTGWATGVDGIPSGWQIIDYQS